MADNIYKKMEKMREAIRKAEFSSFSELLEVINKKAKTYKVLPLFCYYDKLATLSIVDMDEISMVLKFQIPVDLISVKSAKEHLYKMAFDIEDLGEVITPKQYVDLIDTLTKKNVTEKEILERYNITSLAGMTTDIYRRCMAALAKSK